MTKSPTPSVGVAWASVAGAAGISYQLVGFNAGASAHSAAVTVLFGSTEKYREYVGGSKSGSAVSEHYGLDGPIAGEGESLIVKSQGQPGATHCFANMYYRVVKL